MKSINWVQKLTGWGTDIFGTIEGSILDRGEEDFVAKSFWKYLSHILEAHWKVVTFVYNAISLVVYYFAVF